MSIEVTLHRPRARKGQANGARCYSGFFAVALPGYLFVRRQNVRTSPSAPLAHKGMSGNTKQRCDVYEAFFTRFCFVIAGHVRAEDEYLTLLPK